MTDRPLEGRVLITGGAGYLGRAIIRRAQREHWPAEITIFSRDEAKHIRVRNRYPGIRIIRGDVTGPVDDLARTFAGFDTLIHAGANKLVDIGELNAFEVVQNNVVGSMNVAKAAMQAGVRTVVGIATDKLVQPVNTYGATKFLMERLFQEADRLSDTRFVCARYGNVIGSTISVITYFREQLARQGYIEVTNPAMTRFYMGADEAIDAILYALHHAASGSVVIPKMHAMRLADVADLALAESPLTNGEGGNGARIKVVGDRPGEKLHESLLHEQESVRVSGEWGDYFELRPVGENRGTTPFSITSDRPPLGWMPPERMEELIRDSEDV